MDGWIDHGMDPAFAKQTNPTRVKNSKKPTVPGLGFRARFRDMMRPSIENHSQRDEMPCATRTRSFWCVAMSYLMSHSMSCSKKQTSAPRSAAPASSP